MNRLWLIWTLVLLTIPAPGLAEIDRQLFPKPPELVPAVEFWKRIYAEVSTAQGLLHDSRNLAVVYEVVELPKGASSRTRSRHIKRRKAHIDQILGKLASGKRSGLTAEERRILSLFPEGVSSGTLRASRGRIRFQLGQSDKFQAGLRRQGRWGAYIQKVLRERGLPLALSALPHVESSYNPEARSHVGASGLWQFTRSTGRLYMRVDHVLDERNDPYLATVAAARLLQANYERTKT